MTLDGRSIGLATAAVAVLLVVGCQPSEQPAELTPEQRIGPEIVRSLGVDFPEVTLTECPTQDDPRCLKCPKSDLPGLMVDPQKSTVECSVVWPQGGDDYWCLSWNFRVQWVAENFENTEKLRFLFERKEGDVPVGNATGTLDPFESGDPEKRDIVRSNLPSGPLSLGDNPWEYGITVQALGGGAPEDRYCVDPVLIFHIP